MSRFSPFRARLWSSCGALGFVVCAACNNADATIDTAVENADPPTLAVLGALRADGQAFDTTAETIDWGCDARVTFRFGPREATGQLENWLLRPPGTCGDIVACGYLRVTLETDAGDLVLARDGAQLDVLFDLGGVDVRGVRRVRAQLFEGDTMEPYLVNDESIEVSWDVRLEAQECPSGLGGAGAGGAGGSEA